METCWLKKAVRERDSLLEFIADDNPQAAYKLYAKIMAVVDRLGVFPYSGSILRGRIRICYIRPIRIEYVVTATSVVIVGVFHTSKPFDQKAA